MIKIYANITNMKSKQRQEENTKNVEKRKTSLPKEQVEKADLSKPLFNKIMTTKK